MIQFLSVSLFVNQYSYFSDSVSLCVSICKSAQLPQPYGPPSQSRASTGPRSALGLKFQAAMEEDERRTEV